MECLFWMGFEESKDGEYLILPEERNLDVVRLVRDTLVRETEKLKTPEPNSQQIVTSESLLQSSSTARSHTATSYQLRESERAFASRIQDGMRRVLQYENQHTQAKARSIVPIANLQSEAESNLQSNQSKEEKKRDVMDFLLLALLKWFKFSFFKWVDTLPCSQCGGKTKHNGRTHPSDDDLRWGGSTVEAHLCNVCNSITRFPRYTNPEKLLETRLGRCGEWADCFTFCCRALGFEARYVMDWTDHVWTEVYSASQCRWLHCDPCENVCDKPLLYESGWGKKLTYVIAVSKDEVQDVTWRYSAKHEELLKRRQLCRESWLRQIVHQLWRKQISTGSEQRQKELWNRLLCELTEFICVKASDESLPGRSTGSVEWRQARGELGNQSIPSSSVTEFVFSPTENERESEMIHVVYNSSSDKYVRKSAGNTEYKGWDRCHFSQRGIFRKEELDWGMTYLARTDNTSAGTITWKFDLTGTDLRIGKVELKAQCAVFESGQISWRICAGDYCFTQTGASLQDFMTFDMNGSKSMSVTAVLEGGKGDNAWQHTQLFRQSLSDTVSNPFDIKLMLN